MKIAVNTRFLIKGKMTGLGHFTYELLKQLVAQHPEDEFIFLFDRSYDPDFVFASNITPVVVFPQARAPFLFYWWFEWVIPSVIKKYKADVFLSPDNFMSLSLNIPTVLVIHDLAFEHFPKDLSISNRWYYKYFMPLFARKASKIATVSLATKLDIIDQYNIPSDKIEVVGLGLNEGFERPKETLESEDYFLHIGTIQPRKNIVRLLQAFEAYKVQTGNATKLIFIGGKGWKDRRIYDYLDTMRFKEEVVFEGYLTNQEISQKLQKAIALLCVSYFEGFGMPVIEAQQSGCPVICSNISSLPEAAGGGALLVDPYDVPTIAQSMQLIKDDRSLRESLIQEGYKNVEKYSWKVTAEKVWECLISVIPPTF